MRATFILTWAAIASQCNGLYSRPGYAGSGNVWNNIQNHVPNYVTRPVATRCLPWGSSTRCTTISSEVLQSTDVSIPTTTSIAVSKTASTSQIATTKSSAAVTPGSSSSSSETTKSTSSSTTSSTTSSATTKSSSASSSYTRGAGYGPASLSYTVPAGFPSGVFSSYYKAPAATAQPQPAVYDSFLGYQFPLNLTDPSTIPTVNTDPVVYPPSMNSSANGTVLQYWAMDKIQGILNGTAGFTGNCTKCRAALEVGQVLAQQAPQNFPAAMAALCINMKYQSKTFCNGVYGPSILSTNWATLFQHIDVRSPDAQWICNKLFSTQPLVSGSFCSAPATVAQSTKGLIKKPKPSNVSVPRRSGKTFKVPHLSDIHLDPRYGVGSEASTSCGSFGCCRPGAASITNPAPLYGAYTCDAPYNLVVSALESIRPIIGNSSNDKIEFSLFTGDLLVHMPVKQMSFDFQLYTEAASYQMLKHFLPDSPVYAVLGNHDSGPENFAASYELPGTYGDRQKTNYEHLAALWKGNGWIDDEAAAEVKKHFAAYSTNHPKYPKLKIISMNTDFWYSSNTNNFVQSSDPDNSGLFTFLVDELQAAEDAGERVWLIGHVAPGWSGTQAMPNHSDLFYQIVERYSPHVIANIFFGHSHADQLSIYYSGNGTSQTAKNALAPAWIAPGLTPSAGHNPAWRFYEVDTGDFNIYDAYTFTTDADQFAHIDPVKTGPVWELEYSTRAAYGDGIKWPQDAPLNATFWHQVTEAMKTNLTMVGDFNTYQFGTSVQEPGCATSKCASKLVCFMRSGSVALGQAC